MENEALRILDRRVAVSGDHVLQVKMKRRPTGWLRQRLERVSGLGGRAGKGESLLVQPGSAEGMLTGWGGGLLGGFLGVMVDLEYRTMREMLSESSNTRHTRLRSKVADLVNRRRADAEALGDLANHQQLIGQLYPARGHRGDKPALVRHGFGPQITGFPALAGSKTTQRPQERLGVSRRLPFFLFRSR